MTKDEIELHEYTSILSDIFKGKVENVVINKNGKIMFHLDGVETRIDFSEIGLNVIKETYTKIKNGSTLL